MSGLAESKACDLSDRLIFLKEMEVQNLLKCQPQSFLHPLSNGARIFLIRAQERAEICILIFWKSAFFVFLFNNF